jgi:hypothetical protein
MAEFCIATGMSPSDYRSLTALEMGEFVRVIERRFR